MGGGDCNWGQKRKISKVRSRFAMTVKREIMC